jgi:hypothetical protein
MTSNLDGASHLHGGVPTPQVMLALEFLKGISSTELENVLSLSSKPYQVPLLRLSIYTSSLSLTLPPTFFLLHS